MTLIKENKLTIIICLSLILLTLIITFLINFFNKDDEYKYIESNNYLRNYKINEAIPVAITEEIMAKKYYAEYIKYLIFDRDKAYELVDEEQKYLKFTTKDSFNQYIDQIIDNQMISATVTQYEIKNIKGYKNYDIVDKNNNYFRFKEYSIMNYSVYFK